MSRKERCAAPLGLGWNNTEKVSDTPARRFEQTFLKEWLVRKPEDEVCLSPASPMRCLQAAGLVGWVAFPVGILFRCILKEKPQRQRETDTLLSRLDHL